MGELVDCLVVTLLLSLLATSQASVDDKINEAVEYKINDNCTNECDDTDSTFWCGRKREDTDGFIKRCVQYTRTGKPCVNHCRDQDSETYKWCPTNAIVNGNKWDYCSLEGFTVNKVKCVDECSEREDGYFRCHTSTSDKEEEEDYCSPSAKVKTLQITSMGYQCIDECAKYGEDYYWCHKTQNYAGKSPDSTYDTCSLDELHTTYGKECKEKCSKAGENYYWCHTEEGSWGYCSPKAKVGVHISLEPQLDIKGKECRELCGQYGKEYYWCRAAELATWEAYSPWWNYCSPAENVTIYNSPCTDSCARRGETYFWCHTKDDWDYCSPNVYSGVPRIYHQFSAMALFLICCAHSIF